MTEGRFRLRRPTGDTRIARVGDQLRQAYPIIGEDNDNAEVERMLELIAKLDELVNRPKRGS